MGIFVFTKFQIFLTPIAKLEAKELRALNNFILLKEQNIARYIDIEKNLLDIEATYRFIFY